MHIAGVLLPPMSLWGSIASLCLAFRCVQHLNGLGTSWNMLPLNHCPPKWCSWATLRCLQRHQYPVHQLQQPEFPPLELGTAQTLQLQLEAKHRSEAPQRHQPSRCHPLVAKIPSKPLGCTVNCRLGIVTASWTWKSLEDFLPLSRLGDTRVVVLKGLPLCGPKALKASNPALTRKLPCGGTLPATQILRNNAFQICQGSEFSEIQSDQP